MLDKSDYYTTKDLIKLWDVKGAWASVSYIVGQFDIEVFKEGQNNFYLKSEILDKLDAVNTRKQKPHKNRGKSRKKEIELPLPPSNYMYALFVFSQFSRYR